ncbi:hypothetical protein CHELA40_11637 [Chelatococcus asaccharovorans]|nr:hypothetical protein CHELA40_11637 [Chelatococcus asaccharovorans]CAH1684367.1 hypothetical protein CHELA17_63964 [Chelatococcus asaccharovorans]
MIDIKGAARDGPSRRDTINCDVMEHGLRLRQILFRGGILSSKSVCCGLARSKQWTSKFTGLD